MDWLSMCMFQHSSNDTLLKGVRFVAVAGFHKVRLERWLSW
jgi:hypothetical protein